MTEIQQQPATITLLVAHSGALTTASAADFVAGADEVIEVSAIDDPLLQQAVPAGSRFRHIVPRVKGLAHALNLGVSLASSEWIVISFGDENVSSGWLDSVRSIVSAPGSGCIHLFHPKSGTGIPLVVVRRVSFVYGPFDERFVCSKLAVLHWVFRIFPQRVRRLLPDEGLSQHVGDFFESSSCPVVEAPIVGLMELWHELESRPRGALLEQAIAAPDATWQSLLALSDSVQKMTVSVDPCRSGTAYEAKHFWETSSTDYIRWEIYQPDEPEILTLLHKVEPGSVLELGCGAGRNTRYFSAAQRYAGIDISMSLLRRAVERQGPNLLGILHGDVTELPFADATFELVFSDSTVQHVTPDKIRQCVAEIVRVSSEYICLIEYTEEEREDGEWFKQIHMFKHDYRKLFEPYCDMVWHTDTGLRVHPARKEVFLFKKRYQG